jgi:hypothetical protein
LVMLHGEGKKSEFRKHRLGALESNGSAYPAWYKACLFNT